MATAVAASDQRADLSWGEVYPILVRLMRADNWTNIFTIALEYALLANVLAAGAWAYYAWWGGQIGTAAFVALYAAVVIAIGALQHRLSALGHEASHYALFRNKFANEIVSDLLLMFPTLALTHGFRESHLRHHRYLNDPKLDPDVVRLGNAEPGAFPMAKRRFWARYVFGCLWLPDLWRYILGQAKNANAAPGAQPLRNVYPVWAARLMLVGYWVCLIATVHALGVRPLLWLLWLVPLLTTYPFFMQLREIAHHSNAPGTSDVESSRVFRVHPLLSACVFPYGQDDHLVHHMLAAMPHHRTKRAHALLMRHPPYRDNAVVCRGYFFRTPGTDGPSVLDELSCNNRHHAQ